MRSLITKELPKIDLDALFAQLEVRHSTLFSIQIYKETTGFMFIRRRTLCCPTMSDNGYVAMLFLCDNAGRGDTKTAEVGTL
jgi:hypothetical protein